MILLEKKRQWIAQLTNSKDQELFGVSRRAKDNYLGCGDMTPLYPCTYPAWREQLAQRLHPLLQQMLEEGKDRLEVLYSHSKLNITILPLTDYDFTKLERLTLKFSPNPEQFKKLADHHIRLQVLFLCVI